MKRSAIIFNSVIIFLLTIFTAAFSSLSAFAASEASFSGITAVKAGENFDITLTFYSTDEISHVTTGVVYDSDVIEFVSGGGASGSGGRITLDSSPNGDSSEVTVDLTFKGISDGTANIHLENCSIYSANAAVIGSPSAYINVTVSGSAQADDTDSEPQKDETQTETQQAETTAPEVDENGVPTQGVLTSLTVDHGKLTPDFAYNVYDYTVNVGYEVDNVEIDGVTAALSDYIWYEGVSQCQVGENIRRITVTGENGVSTTYTIRIIRAAEGETVQEDDATAEVVTKNAGTSSVSADSVSRTDAMEKYRKILNPALAIALVVLLLALFVIIVWARGKFKDYKSS